MSSGLTIPQLLAERLEQINKVNKSDTNSDTQLHRSSISGYFSKHRGHSALNKTTFVTYRPSEAKSCFNQASSCFIQVSYCFIKASSC